MSNLVALAVIHKSLAVIKAAASSHATSRKRIVGKLAQARALYQKFAKHHKAGRTPPHLEELIAALKQQIENITGDLADGTLAADAWEQQMLDLLAEYYPAALMLGLDSTELDDDALDGLAEQVSAQADFLKDFTIEIQDADEFTPGWNNRAESYADGIKEPYWDGATDMLPLPAMPGDGTSQCLNNCNCGWRIEVLDEEAGDYDCYWELEDGSEHCQTCTERAEQWNPLRIRGFELQD